MPDRAHPIAVERGLSSAVESRDVAEKTLLPNLHQVLLERVAAFQFEAGHAAPCSELLCFRPVAEQGELEAAWADLRRWELIGINLGEAYLTTAGILQTKKTPLREIGERLLAYLKERPW